MNWPLFCIAIFYFRSDQVKSLIPAPIRISEAVQRAWFKRMVLSALDSEMQNVTNACFYIGFAFFYICDSDNSGYRIRTIDDGLIA